MGALEGAAITCWRRGANSERPTDNLRRFGGRPRRVPAGHHPADRRPCVAGGAGCNKCGYQSVPE